MVSPKDPQPVSAERRLQELGVELTPARLRLALMLRRVQTGNLLFLAECSLRSVTNRSLSAGWVRSSTSIKVERRRGSRHSMCCLRREVHLGSLDKVTKVVRLGVYLATEGDFLAHPKVADAASELFAMSLVKTNCPSVMVWRCESSFGHAGGIGSHLKSKPKDAESIPPPFFARLLMPEAAWNHTRVSRCLGLNIRSFRGRSEVFSSQRLTAAVSNFGGLGSFGAHGLEPHAIRDVIAEIRSLTSKPFAMNLWVSMEDEGAFTSNAKDFDRALSRLAPHINAVGGTRPAFHRTNRSALKIRLAFCSMQRFRLSPLSTAFLPKRS